MFAPSAEWLVGASQGTNTMTIFDRVLSTLRRVRAPELKGISPVQTFEDMEACYFAALNNMALNPLTLQNKRGVLQHLRPAFQGRELRSIRPWEIGRLVKSIHDLGLHVTSRHALQELRAMFNVALMEGWVDANPALHVKRLPAPVRRSRLTLEQFTAIHDYSRERMPAWFAIALRLALVTGQRRADLVRLGRGDVRDGHLFVEQQKTGARVAIPLALRLDALNITVAEVVRDCLEYKPLDGEWLLRTGARPHRRLHPQTVSHRFWLAQQAAAPYTGEGTPPTFHEIRSLSARLYRHQGVDTQTLLGHAKASMTEVYEDDRGLTRHLWKYVLLPSSGDKLAP